MVTVAFEVVQFSSTGNLASLHTNLFSMSLSSPRERMFRTIKVDGGSVKRGERDSPEPDDQFDTSSQMLRTWERLEFYAFLVLGSITWYCVVFKVLDWHRFPFHLYQFELWLIVVVPVVLIVALLFILDYIFSKSKTD